MEAGVDAAFRILEKVDGESMLGECMTGILGEVLRDGNPDIPGGRFMDLLRSLGRRRVIHLLGRLVAKPDLLETFTGEGGIYAQSDETILALWENTGNARASGGGGAAEGEESKPVSIWWYVMLVVLALAVAESLLGNRHLAVDNEAA